MVIRILRFTGPDGEPPKDRLTIWAEDEDGRTHRILMFADYAAGLTREQFCTAVTAVVASRRRRPYAALGGAMISNG